jgi:Tfp pilus assembly protein PilV
MHTLIRNHHASAPRRQDGFSMIEALVSAILLSVVVVGLTGLQASVLSSGGESRSRTLALSLANSQLEDLRDFPRQTDYQAMAGTEGGRTLVSDSVELALTWSVSEDMGGYYEAASQVEWVDTSGDTQSVRLSTFIEQAEPVRRGEILLASVSGTGDSPGTSGPAQPVPDQESDEEDVTDGAGDSQIPEGDSSGGAPSGSGGTSDPSDTPSTGGGNGAEPPLTITGDYAGCSITSPCFVKKGSTISVTFALGAGARFDSMSVTGSASSAGSDVDSETGSGRVFAKADNGNNKPFRVSISVETPDGRRETVVLAFVTSNK